MTIETEKRVQPNEPYYRQGEQARRWGAILLLLGLGWLVFAVISRVPFGGFGMVERSVELPPQSFTAGRVVISGVSDAVAIVPGDDDIRVAATKFGYGWNADAANAALERIDLHTEQRGDTLTIEVRRENALGGIIGRAPHVALEIAVPAGVAVEASLVSGDVTIADVQGDATLNLVSGNAEIEAITGDLRVNTTSGDLNVDDIRGTVIATSVSGAITLSGDLREAQISTTSGDVEIEGVSGPISVTTISGSVDVADADAARLNLETTSGDVRFAGVVSDDGRISTISGDVDVRLDADADVRIDARTLSGDLEVDDDLGALERERRRISGTVGAGGPLLDISTTSGDVRIAE